MADSSIMSALMAVIGDRKNNPPAEPSYVVESIRGGVAKIGPKISEEAAEVVEAGTSPVTPAASIWSRKSPTWCFTRPSYLITETLPGADVEAELARRFGISGITEKQSRTKS